MGGGGFRAAAIGGGGFRSAAIGGGGFRGGGVGMGGGGFRAAAIGGGGFRPAAIGGGGFRGGGVGMGGGGFRTAAIAGGGFRSAAIGGAGFRAAAVGPRAFRGSYAAFHRGFHPGFRHHLAIPVSGGGGRVRSGIGLSVRLRLPVLHRLRLRRRLLLWRRRLLRRSPARVDTAWLACPASSGMRLTAARHQAHARMIVAASVFSQPRPSFMVGLLARPLLRIGNAQHAHHPGSDLGVFGRRGQPRSGLRVGALGNRANHVQAASQERRYRLADDPDAHDSTGWIMLLNILFSSARPYFLNQTCIAFRASSARPCGNSRGSRRGNRAERRDRS